MDTYFPKLGGFVKTPERICDELLVAMFSSDYSQSNAFNGAVTSFQYVVHSVGDNFAALGGLLESATDALFSRFFETANSRVLVTPLEEGSSKYSIKLAVVLTDATGQRYDLQSSILAVDGMATKILVGERELWSTNIVG